MIQITFDYDSSRKKGILVSEYLPNIREYFSVEDKQQAFKRRYAVGFRPQTRQYSITPQGRFEPRLIYSIVDFLKEQDISFNIEITDKFREVIKTPNLKTDLFKLNLPLRDYQEESAIAALENKSGVIILPTSAGKTLVIATLVKSIQEQYNYKTLILVPDIQLVTQTYKDFLEYGIPEKDITRWTGSLEPDKDAKIVVSNSQILLSEKQDTSLLKEIKILVIDEVHKIRYGNKINKIIEKIPAIFRFGFTGTLPDDKIDQWNIFGKIGKVVYFKESIDLRDQNYISKVHVAALKLNYKNLPIFTVPSMYNPTAGYEEEIQFLQTNSFRNTIITKLINKSNKNTLVMVDRIAHGEELLRVLSDNTDKQVHFVHGAVNIDEREMIRKLMEDNDNVTCIAISKIFSTGINIKNLHNIVFAAIGKARIKIIQSIGRSLRKHTSKKRATIFDIWDNLRYGNKHTTERFTLYDREQIPYSVTEIDEP